MTHSKATHASIRISLAMFVGFPIVFLILAAFVGSFSDAFALALMSIICTAGIGLVVWIPVCWIVGWIVLKLGYLAFGSKTNDVADALTTEAQKTVPDPALLRYMMAAREHGMDSAAVAQNLTAAGWTADSIELASRYVN